MIIPPGSTIGIVGGGQLGRMLAMAAAQLGYRCHVFDPHERAPAADVAARFTRAAYDDRQALGAFAAQVDVATYEFENLPAEPLEALATSFAPGPARWRCRRTARTRRSSSRPAATASLRGVACRRSRTSRQRWRRSACPWS